MKEKTKTKQNPNKTNQNQKTNRFGLGDSQDEAVTKQGVKQIKYKAVN